MNAHAATHAAMHVAMHSGMHAAWSRPGLQAQVVRTRHDGRHEAALRVANLQQPRQVLRLEGLLQASGGVHRLDLDVSAQRLRASWDPAQMSLPRLLDICAGAGCPAQPLAASVLDHPRRREAHAALKRLVIAGLFAMQAMMFASVLYLAHVDTVGPATRQLFRWLGLLAATPVVLWAASPFFRGAMDDLRRRRLTTETPVALALGLIYLASVFAAVRGHGEIYFDSISMFVLVLLTGRYLEMRARHQSGALGEAAADATPVAAERRRADGSLELVAVNELVPGDRVHVAEGASVPTDGRLASAKACVDESLLSGESRPLRRVQGEPVVAGSVAVDGPLELRVERGAAGSTAAALGALAARMGAARKTAGRDAAAARFTVRVLLLTAATAVFWLLLNPERAFDASVAVLVVACPCAFALAQPAASSRLLGVLARAGVWVARVDALPALARADTALCDKTGTLTTPHLDVTRVAALRGDDAAAMLQLAAALARESRHPRARALAAAVGDGPLPGVHAVEVVAGGGIHGSVHGRLLHLGSAAFVGAAVGDTTPTSSALDGALLLADVDGVLARFDIDEQLRADALPALTALVADGMTLHIVSGDADVRVRETASQLQVAHWHARQSPADKLACLEKLREGGAVVLAVGDGSNDAPLLAAADVSAALIGGTALAQAHADLLLGDGLAGLPLARQLARRAQTITTHNRRWSLIYNLGAVPFAALGFVPPWLAALGMSVSSLLVVLNTLRIKTPGSGA